MQVWLLSGLPVFSLWISQDWPAKGTAVCAAEVRNLPVELFLFCRILFFFFGGGGGCHILTWTAMELHVFPIPIPPPTSLSTRFLWVFPVQEAWALVSRIPCILLNFWVQENMALLVEYQQPLVHIGTPLRLETRLQKIIEQPSPSF